MLIFSFNFILLYFCYSGRKVKFFNTDFIKSGIQIVNRLLVGWWVGFGCGWAKLNVLQFGSACVLALQLF